MVTQKHTVPEANNKIWVGWILSTLLVLFLLFDGIVKFTTLPSVVDANTKIGYSMTTAPKIGLLELICTILYVIPSTSIIGAVLLTAYLGGATASHVRVGQPPFFPIIFGILLWVGLYFRSHRLRTIVAQLN